MGWRRRTRQRQSRCSRVAFAKAQAKGPEAVAVFFKLCGAPPKPAARRR